jgi:2-amino-4-hydroxy-6-hydroxymethyldihydropteridine diphosphokinase
LDGVICYIGIGSNLGDALKNCEHAAENLNFIEEITLIQTSSFYKTEPVGIETQNYFINAVAEIKTRLLVRDLWEALQKIEKSMGRERNTKGGPRIIDLDLLFYGRDIIQQSGLTVPHPELYKRRFVLEPLNEIASYFIHPAFGISVRGLKNRLEDDKFVEIIRK